MPILNKIRILSESISKLIHLKNSLVDEFIQMGGQWEELALVDKFSAIKVCCQQTNCNLMAAKSIVEKYIEDRS